MIVAEAAPSYGAKEGHLPPTVSCIAQHTEKREVGGSFRWSTPGASCILIEGMPASRPRLHPGCPPPIPRARVVRQGALHAPQPSMRDRMVNFVTPTMRTREALAIVVGLWPLVLSLGLMVALLWSAGFSQP